ncbi:THUMP domain-containing protein 1 [Entomortierella beljakovae]|nr:THUMP domain-containing protein 1 [Entomortierella beljakovae]
MGGNKRKAGNAQEGKDGKKTKTDIHKVGKYLPGGFPIDPKMKGVMVTCARGKETLAGKEACDLLSEYAEKLYGTGADEDEDEDEDESIEDAIAREVAEAKKKRGGKKFLPLMTGTDCVRHNVKVEREALVKMLASAAGKDQKHTVNLNEPNLVILAEVIKSICFLSVVKDYEKLRKYNIQSIFEDAQKESKELQEDQTVSKDESEEVPDDVASRE